MSNQLTHKVYIIFSFSILIAVVKKKVNQKKMPKNSKILIAKIMRKRIQESKNQKKFQILKINFLVGMQKLQRKLINHKETNPTKGS